MITSEIEEYLSTAFRPTSERVRELILSDHLHIDDVRDFRSKFPNYYNQIDAACKNYLWGDSTKLDDAYVPAEEAYHAVWKYSISRILTLQDQNAILNYVTRSKSRASANDDLWELREDPEKPLAVVGRFLRERKYKNWTTKQIADITNLEEHQVKEALSQLKGDKQIYAYKVKHDGIESQVNQWCPHHYQLGYGSENKVEVMADVVLMVVSEFPGITYKRLEGNKNHVGMIRRYLRKFDKTVLSEAIKQLEEARILKHSTGRANCKKFYLESQSSGLNSELVA